MSEQPPLNDLPYEFSIETERLILRDYRPDDLAAVHTFRSDPAAVRFMSDQPEPATVAETIAWLDGAIHHNALRPRDAWNLAVATKDPAHVIGWIGFGGSENHIGEGHHGVGYMLNSAEWGKGYATEALSAAIAFMHDTLGGEAIWAHCFAANLASERVMQKAGMHFVRDYIDEETGEPWREYVHRR